MESVFFEVLNRSISASWFIFAIIILRSLLRKAPRWTACLLWGFVAIRLLSPFHIESLFSLIPSSETISPAIVYEKSPAIHTGIAFLNTSINPVISKTFAPAPAVSVNPLQIYFFIAAWLWIIGTAGMLIYALFRCITIRKQISASVLTEQNFYIGDYIPTPFIFGIIKPKIYLPSSLHQKIIPFVLHHEHAHLRRKDHYRKPLGYILLSINWFNPFMWIAYHLLCQDIEAACDESVIRNMSLTEKKEYSQALLQCSTNRHRIACPLAFSEVNTKNRIQKILYYKHPSFWITLVAILLCLAAAIVFLTDPKDKAADTLSPFGKEYVVSEIIFDAPQYSFTYSLETAPHYKLHSNNELSISENTEPEEWRLLGSFEPHTLSSHDFEAIAFDALSPITADELINNNSSAWELIVAETDSGLYYLLLQQNDGSIYLCIGHHEAITQTLRWIFKLQEKSFSPISEEELTFEPEVVEAEEITKEEALELAIHNVILDHGRSTHTANYFPCESHILLDEETMAVCGIDDETSYEETTVYLMVLYQEYDLSKGVIEDYSGSHMPAAITFMYKNDLYHLKEYWTPQDGAYYLPSIQEKFPEHCWDLAADTQLHILGQIQSCYAQAIEFAGLDTDAILDNLYREIEQSPAESSNPGAYIDAHSIAFREITYYGMYALEHAYKAFLKEEQIGLRGHLMALSCQYILKNMGEPFSTSEYMTGHEWFEKFKIYALSIKQEIESPYSSQFRPAIRLLLDLI